MKKLVLGIVLISMLGLWGCKKEELPPAVFNVKATDFAFAPAEFRVQEGQQVVINLENDGKVPHDIAIRKTEIRTSLVQPGMATQLKFTAPEEGEYGVYCTVSGHFDQGMKGTFIVE